MKKLISVLIAFTVILFIGCSDEITTPLNNDNFNKDLTTSESLDPGQLTPDEIAGLILMRQEEKLARDVYTVLYNNWEMPLFEGIILSEQKHMDAVKRLLIKYNITDPVTDDGIGAFSDQVFVQKFLDLTEQGLISKPEAINVGVIIEEEDIVFLENQLSFVTPLSLIKVYTNLKLASESHLATFLKHVTADEVM